MRSLVILFGLAIAAQAHDAITTKITWTKEMSRLMFKRCATCHHEGGSSFSLMTYDEARPWAKAIRDEALNRRMPPWQAVKGFGDFRDDRGLTQEDLELISDWVEGGAPEGDPKFLPPAPDKSSWDVPRIPAKATAMPLQDGSAIPQRTNITAIRPKELTAGSTVQVVAIRPDGTVEPLIWLYKYNPKYVRTYSFTAPISLPAGTKISTSPPGAGIFDLFSTKNRQSGH